MHLSLPAVLFHYVRPRVCPGSDTYRHVSLIPFLTNQYHLEVPRVDYKKLIGDRMQRRVDKFVRKYKLLTMCSKDVFEYWFSDLTGHSLIRAENRAPGQSPANQK